MASRYEAEVVISSAKDLKNINWRHGPLRPYAVVWVDPNQKSSTRVDEEGDNSPLWDHTLVIPLPPGPIDSHTLHIDVVHAGREEDTKPLIGSAKLPLRDVIDEAGGVGSGERVKRSLTLKRPSGRPQGKIEVKVAVREPIYQAPDARYAPPYGYGVPVSRDPYAPGPPAGYGAPYGGPPNYGYGAPVPQPYYAAAAPPPSGYPVGYGSGGGYGAPPPTAAYGQPSYGGGYGQNQTGYVQEEKKKGKFGGMGTGLAVGAVAGALGGIALVEGFDALEDKIADDAAEKVEDDLGYDDDDF
ncbi:unnamed protein product [Linum tenue]|uniref:C2 domain-containing protein n=1 Tax=Linum tenue TaxID=586396 RepID=A0AAV0QN81_9ROSI|nr:unnamed protein product [Linum tenue]